MFCLWQILFSFRYAFSLIAFFVVYKCYGFDIPFKSNNQRRIFEIINTARIFLASLCVLHLLVLLFCCCVCSQETGKRRRIERKKLAKRRKEKHNNTAKLDDLNHKKILQKIHHKQTIYINCIYIYISR